MNPRIPLPTTTTTTPLLLLLLLLLLLSLPSVPHPTHPFTLPTTNLTTPETPYCLDINPHCTRPDYADCVYLLTYILSNPASRKLREFTLSAPPTQSDWQVPSTFYHRSCRLTLSPITALEWSSFAEIAGGGVEVLDMCLGPDVPAGKYSAGYNVAGLGGGLGVFVHGRVEIGVGDDGGTPAAGGGVDLARRAQGQSCERVDEGRVVDLRGLAGLLNGSVVGATISQEEEQVGTAKVARGNG